MSAMSAMTASSAHLRGARAEVEAIARGQAPCGRCLVVHASEGQLAAHLEREHLMGEDQARREAHEAATGIQLDADGRCLGCQHREGDGHTAGCYVARRAERRGYGRPAPRWDGRVR
jgi:hypothetical protein